ncbi:MAG: MFS transporter [Bifidobacteriaceae bacterium]|nr:MFS transporter [Bifidobacteriaceae bacterium]MCI1979727.1 MFS transporter [Bifidobacteriaceae bacterium]
MKKASFKQIRSALYNRLFSGYAELLATPHSPRFAIGAVIAAMPYPMIGMTITISVQHYYGSYGLAGSLTAVQAIALAIVGPVLGKLVDRFGQRKVSIPTIFVWMAAAIGMVTAITSHAPTWVLFTIAPFLAAIPPWGAMSRTRWTHLLNGKPRKIETALSLSSIFDECLWVVGNPLASILAVISGVLAFSFTGICVLLGAFMFLGELTTEPPSQTDLARAAGLSRKEYRAKLALKIAQPAASPANVAGTLVANKVLEEDAKRRRRGLKHLSLHLPKKADSIMGPGLLSLCATWFGLGAFQSATSISVIAMAKEQNMQQFTGFVFACFSISSLIGVTIYGAKHWQIALWKRFYFCLAVLVVGMCSFMFTSHLWAIMIIYLIIGVCQAPTWVNGNQIVLHLVPPARFTEAVAWMSAMNSIGGSMGSSIAGVYIDQNGSKGGFATVFAFAIAALAIAFIGFKQIRTSTEKPMLTEVSL